MVGTRSLQWWNCGRGVASGWILAGQRTAIGLRVPPRCEASSFSALVRRAAGPGPAGVVLVVGLRRPEHIEAAEFVERVDVLLDGLGIPFWASNSLIVPFWPSPEEPLSPQM